MELYKTRWFARYARQERLDDANLRDAIARAERGLVDADLGGGLIKQRVARQGKGRSGGYRVIIAYLSGDRAFFVYAFAKNEVNNIKHDQLLSLRSLGLELLAASADVTKQALQDGALQEMEDGSQK